MKEKDKAIDNKKKIKQGKKKKLSEALRKNLLRRKESEV
jgi:hypothetical protein